jgi:HrpA-like RNA helicase
MYLTRAISPPKTVAIESAWSTLEELGAISQDGKLTALGRHMVGLRSGLFDAFSDYLKVDTSSRPSIG